MRNEKYFDINIFDEKIALPEELPKYNNLLFHRTLTQKQRALHQSPHLRRISLAGEKWGQVCAKNDDALYRFFKERGEKEFSQNSGIFNAGKFWQMADYMDGNYISRMRNENGTKKSPQERKDYQNRMIENIIMNQEEWELLQTGWDLTINSALLSDIMPTPRRNGSVYLFKNIIGDTNSLLYPSITNEFQKRVINESFWQTALEINQLAVLPVLEKILTIHYKELDPTLAQDNFLRWTPRIVFEEIEKIPLIQEINGFEDKFRGLSRRAIENYGRFIDNVIESYEGDPRDFDSLIKSYLDAVHCGGEETGYFSPKERERLLGLSFVDEMMESSLQD